MRAAMYSKGIEIYCAPTADARDSWVASVRHIAVEGRCFVLSCNQFNRRRDFPADYSSAFSENPDQVVTRGGSCIVDPFGNFLAGPNFESEAILIAEIDRAQIVRGKYDLDVVGHYARPDIFQLQVDERPKQPVTIQSAESTRKEEPQAQSAPPPGSRLPRITAADPRKCLQESTWRFPVKDLILYSGCCTSGGRLVAWPEITCQPLGVLT